MKNIEIGQYICAYNCVYLSLQNIQLSGDYIFYDSPIYIYFGRKIYINISQ